MCRKTTAEVRDGNPVKPPRSEIKRVKKSHYFSPYVQASLKHDEIILTGEKAIINFNLIVLIACNNYILILYSP